MTEHVVSIVEAWSYGRDGLPKRTPVGDPLIHWLARCTCGWSKHCNTFWAAKQSKKHMSSIGWEQLELPLSEATTNERKDQ